MKFKLKFKVVSLFFIVFFAGVIAIQVAQGANDYGLGLFNSEELYEENAFQPAFDLWINETSTLPLAVEKYGIESIQRGWTLRHVVLLPMKDNEKDNFVVSDPTAEIVRVDPYTFSAMTDTNDPGYNTFADRETAIKVNYDQMDIGSEGVGQVIDYNPDYLNNTVYPTQGNYTSIDSTNLYACVTYQAGDGKSINDYAEELAEADGEKLNAVHNATALGFGYGNQDGHINQAWCFDEELSSLYVEKGKITFQSSTLVRHRIWLHQKEVSQDWTGWKARTKHTEFRPIEQASGSLPGIPSGAQYFYSKPIGSAYWGDSVSTMLKLNKETGEYEELSFATKANGESYTFDELVQKAIQDPDGSYKINLRIRGLDTVVSQMMNITKMIFGIVLTGTFLIILVVLIIAWRKGWIGKLRR